MLTVQISRNGHALWVHDARELEDGVYVGIVATQGVPGFPFGSAIAFVDFKGHTEVYDIKQDGVSVLKPTSKMVN